MKTIEGFNYEDDSVLIYRRDNIGIVRIKTDFFQNLINLEKASILLSLFDIAEADDSIRLVLIVNEDKAFGSTAYRRFVEMITGRNFSSNDEMMKSLTKSERKILRQREINILQRMIKSTLHMSKITVLGLRGRVVTPFFGSSLACDFRLAAEDMRFAPAHLMHNIYPSGSLPFLLSRHIGISRAVPMLFSCDEIDAERALREGIIHKILPVEHFEELCMEQVEKLCSLPNNVVKATKFLLYDLEEELERNFERERRFIDINE